MSVEKVNNAARAKAAEAELERQLNEDQRGDVVPAPGILKRHQSYETAIQHSVEPLPPQLPNDELGEK